MRLTLRTLIAYLDDVLEPTQIKEIGKKLEESSYASSLVERIKDVLRRRRLTAPEVEGPGSNPDPNTVAEYLDNTLSPESVADVEKICLNSDVNLVEVAASHQILTLVLGEPATINPDTRERIYGLGPVPRSEQVETGQTADAAPPAAVPPVAPAPSFSKPPTSPETVPAQTPEPFSSRIPDYLKTKPLWKRFTPYFLVLAAAVVWAGLFFNDPTFFPSFFSQKNGTPQVASNHIENEEVDLSKPQEPAPEQPGVENATAVAPANAADKQAAKATPAATQPAPEGDTVAMTTKPPAFDAPPPADAESAAPQAVPAKPPVENLLPATATPAATASTTKPAAAPATPPTAPVKPDDKTVALNSNTPANTTPATPAKIEMADVVAKAPAAQIESEDGFFLAQVDQKRELADKNDWLILSKVMPIQAGSSVASPEPFTARINIPEALCKVVLLPGTEVTYQGKNKAAEMGFQIQEGRLRIEASRGLNDARDAAGPTLSIKVNDELWRIELVTRDSVCGIEIDPVQPTHTNQKPSPDNYTGILYAYSGMIRFSDGSGKVHTIDAGHWMSLSAKDRKAGRINPSDREKPLRVPHWVEPNFKDNSYLARRQIAAFSKELKDDQLVSLTMPAITKDLKPNTSDLATKALALTNRYQELVKVLDEVDHHESRMEAVKGIRNWLLRDPGNGELLSATLNKQFSPEMAETMDRLLWGFQKEDAQDRFLSSRLVEWLEHPHVAVRELAFNYIHQLTDRPIDYSDIATPTQRRSTARRWFAHIDKHGSLVEPKNEPVTPPDKVFNPDN
jgi:hypothetical protein